MTSSMPAWGTRLATLGLTFLAPYLVDIAVSFGPEDYFALMVVAFVTVSATFGDSPVRGLTSLFIGLLLGLVGIDILSGQSRLSFLRSAKRSTSPPAAISMRRNSSPSAALSG